MGLADHQLVLIPSKNLGVSQTTLGFGNSQEGLMKFSAGGSPRDSDPLVGKDAGYDEPEEDGAVQGPGFQTRGSTVLPRPVSTRSSLHPCVTAYMSVAIQGGPTQSGVCFFLGAIMIDWWPSGYLSQAEQHH